MVKKSERTTGKIAPPEQTKPRRPKARGGAAVRAVEGMGKPSKLSKKKLVQQEIFEICRRRGDMTFDNNLVRDIAQKNDFGSPFDVTKTDNSGILAPAVLEQGYCIAHLGRGKHRFLKAANVWFHRFEKIATEPIKWPYRRSLLNETDTSESNILSVGFNQRIIHDFLYEDIVASPKMYNARRTKITTNYAAGAESLALEKVQMEIDLTTEYLGTVTIFEGKNKFPDDFAVYQLFHPFLHFKELQKKKQLSIKAINCCYMLREKKKGNSIIRLFLYTFDKEESIGSIRLVKSAEYHLVTR